MTRTIKIMELSECPPEAVTDYERGEENLYLRGLSGDWYLYKLES